MKTAVAADDPSSFLTWEDAVEWIDWQANQRVRFLNQLEWQRIGQAWFNSLKPADAEKLRGTYADPYHTDTLQGVLIALAFLLES